jgi:type IV pilus assembly protein PilE
MTILLGARTPRCNRMKGFTLIELMIVVAVVAILAAIAYPSYQDSVRKARRGQAKADMIEYAQMAERFHSLNNTYVGFALPHAGSPRETPANPRYRLALDGQNATRFRITATPQGDQARDRCGTLTIDQRGVKTNSKGTLAECW